MSNIGQEILRRLRTFIETLEAIEAMPQPEPATEPTWDEVMAALRKLRKEAREAFSWSVRWHWDGSGGLFKDDDDWSTAVYPTLADVMNDIQAEMPKPEPKPKPEPVTLEQATAAWESILQDMYYQDTSEEQNAVASVLGDYLTQLHQKASE